MVEPVGTMASAGFMKKNGPRGRDHAPSRGHGPRNCARRNKSGAPEKSAAKDGNGGDRGGGNDERHESISEATRGDCRASLTNRPRQRHGRSPAAAQGCRKRRGRSTGPALSSSHDSATLGTNWRAQNVKAPGQGGIDRAPEAPFGGPDRLWGVWPRPVGGRVHRPLRTSYVGGGSARPEMHKTHVGYPR